MSSELSFGLDQPSQASLFDQDNVDQVASDDIQTEYNNTDSILFAIDCSPKMSVPDEDGNIPLQIAFEAVQSVMISKIFSSETDLVGVLLYGTEKKNNVANHDHIYLLYDLDIPDAVRIKETEAIGTNDTDIVKEYGSTSEEFPVGNMFWACSDVFSSSARKKGTKRIFLITNNDDPHATNPNLRNAAIQRAKDLWDVGVRIELFGLDRPDHEFDTSLFYSDIVAFDDSTETNEDYHLDSKGKVSGKLEELMKRIRRKEVKKRSQFRVPFHLAPGFTIGVRGYATVMEQRRGAYQHAVTSGQQLKLAEALTQWKCADSGQYLLPADIKYYFPYGGKDGEKIVFTAQDLATVRNFGDPSLTLIGFKPTSTLSPYYNIGHSYFLYPNETDYEGSTRTFSALLQSMLKLGRVAICSFIRRSNALPKIVALYPQKEELDAHGLQIVPPGFQLILLPFADDIRPLPVDTLPHWENLPEQERHERIDAAKRIIERLFFKSNFDPTAYENPSLQRHYATLQAIALDKPIDDSLDATLPDTEKIHLRVGQSIEEFKTLIGSNQEDVSEGSKHALSEFENESDRQKRAKSDQSVEDHWRNQSLNKCTLPVLKEWLKENGTKPRGNKAEVMEQVADILTRRHQDN